LAWRDLREQAALAARGPEAWMQSVGLPEHLSHSQISTLADCGAKYFMQRSETLGVRERPEWATTGGSAFHNAVEWFERLVLEAGTRQAVSDRIALAGGLQVVWSGALHAEIADVAAANPDFAANDWRASKKGAEGYTWWLINGQTMLERYAAARLAELAQPWREPLMVPQAGQPAPAPAFELPFEMQIEGVPFRGVIDQVWLVTGSSDTAMRRGDLLIDDLKTGASDPDESQLREYALAVHRLAGVLEPGGRIWGRFYDARKGTWSEPQLLIGADEHGVQHGADAAEELAFKVEYAAAQKQSGRFMPRQSNYCNGCSVKHACPIFATKSA
jgi:hypothetical protein